MNIGLNGRSPLQFIFINGRGSSGKDTQANLLVEDNENAVRLSTGEMYRNARNPEHPMHEVVAPYIEASDKGAYLPQEVVFKLVDRSIAEQLQEGKNTFIFTGFPRTDEQLTSLDSYLNDIKEEGVSLETPKFLDYAIDPEISRERANIRRTQFLADGLEPRADDNPEVVENRLQTYDQLTQPMLDRLNQEGRLITIPAVGSINEVAELTREVLGFAPIGEGMRPMQERK